MACRLCRRNKPLRKSHIIPAFFWKPLKQEEGKFYALPSEADRSEFKIQDGPKEPLLCEDCEQQLGRYENYVRQVIYSEPADGDYGFRITSCDEGVQISGLDYGRFKLFQLSVLWRAHISTIEFYREVNLRSHAEKIRSMLLDENPGLRTDYGCFMAGVLENPKKALDNVVLTPKKGRLQGHYCYLFVMGGCLWYYVVSSHSRELQYADRFIGPEGILILPMNNWKELKMFKEIAQQFRNRGLA